MENNPNGNAQQSEVSPYADGELIAQAAGDPRYLDRLVGLRIAKDMLAEAPYDPGLQKNLTRMEEALGVFKNPHP